MTDRQMPLPDTSLPKAQVYMRAFRRAVVEYWYATLADRQTAVLAATRACFEVNILDEAVFQSAHSQSYKELRARDHLGKVVMGLELVRNCEVHAPVIFDGLLSSTVQFGVPLSTTSPASLNRQVYTWAWYDELPNGYVQLTGDATDNQRRARKEAQDGYRKAVQGRSVIETLLDAMAFFQSLDERLVVSSESQIRCPCALLPEQSGGFQLYQPMWLDRFEIFLPDLACRPWERRSAHWPAADQVMKDRARQARKQLPSAHAREVLHTIVRDGKVIGYSGYTPWRDGQRSPWVERKSQVWRDTRAGYRYYMTDSAGTEIDLECHGQQHVAAWGTDGHDLLAGLVPTSSGGLNDDWLAAVEEYPDMYLQMRIHEH